MVINDNEKTENRRRGGGGRDEGDEEENVLSYTASPYIGPHTAGNGLALARQAVSLRRS